MSDAPESRIPLNPRTVAELPEVITFEDGATTIAPLTVTVPDGTFVLYPVEPTALEAIALNVFLVIASASGAHVERVWASLSPSMKRHFRKLVDEPPAGVLVPPTDQIIRP